MLAGSLPFVTTRAVRYAPFYTATSVPFVSPIASNQPGSTGQRFRTAARRTQGAAPEPRARLIPRVGFADVLLPFLWTRAAGAAHTRGRNCYPGQLLRGLRDAASEQ